jgi:hypothetical protein
MGSTSEVLEIGAPSTLLYTPVPPTDQRRFMLYGLTLYNVGFGGLKWLRRFYRPMIYPSFTFMASSGIPSMVPPGQTAGTDLRCKIVPSTMKGQYSSSRRTFNIVQIIMVGGYNYRTFIPTMSSYD